MLSSTVLISDASGKVLQRYRYDPFGEIEQAKGNSDNRFLFNGKEADESGLSYYGARYYNSITGRWISRDPLAGEIMKPEGLNRYQFNFNNPIKYIDLDGNVIIYAIKMTPELRKISGEKQIYYATFLDPVSQTAKGILEFMPMGLGSLANEVPIYLAANINGDKVIETDFNPSDLLIGFAFDSGAFIANAMKMKKVAERLKWMGTGMNIANMAVDYNEGVNESDLFKYMRAGNIPMWATSLKMLKGIVAASELMKSKGVDPKKAGEIINKNIERLKKENKYQ